MFSLKRRKWVLLVSVAVLALMGLWMRALSSWRPQTLAQLDFAASQLVLTPDGKILLATD
jgi:O-methyltransferase involved in polyketide biosynthesis